MNILQLEKNLSLHNIFPTAREICSIIGMAEESYSRKKKACTDIKPADIKKIEQKYNITLFDNNLTSTITIQASCGSGVINADIDYLNLDNSAKYIYCFINGNSMADTLWSGDMAIIKVQDYIDKQNDIYCFTYDETQYCKRLSTNLDQLIITSDNKKYDDFKLLGQETDKVKVIGRVVGVIRRF